MTDVGTVTVRVNADTRDFQSGMAQTEGRLQSFGSSVKGASGILMASLVPALAYAGVAAVKTFATFEQSLNSFQAVTGATATEMERVSAAAQQLGADMTLPATSAKDAAAAMTELAKGGLDVEEAMAAAKGTLQLAAAAGIEAADAATISARALNMFGLEGKEAGRVADLLAASANASTGEITDMADALQMSGSVAAAAGIPIEDLVTAISEMANAGIVGSDAGTSLKQMLLSLQAPTDKAAALMKELGISVYDAQGKLKPMRAIVQEFTSALSGMTQQQRNAALATIFGSDAVRAANVVLMGGTKAWDDMSAAVNKAGAAQDLAAAKTKGLAGAWEGMKSQLEGAAIIIGGYVAPVIESALKQISTAIQLVAALLTGDWAKAWEMAKEIVMTKVNEIKDRALQAFELLKSGASAAWNAIQTAAAAAWGLIRGVIQAAWAAIQSATTTALGVIRSGVSAAWSAIQAATSTAWNAIKAGLQAVFNAIVSAARSAWDNVKNATTAAWNAIKSAVTAAINAVKSVITSALNAIQSTAQSVWNKVKSIFQSAVGAIRSAAGAIAAAFGPIISGLMAIVSAAQSAISWLQSLGSVSVNADVSGITGSIGTVNGRAVGGPVARGMSYVVGEKGPEMFVPDSNGTIVPNHRMGAGGGMGMAPVNVQVFIDGRQVAAAVRTEFARTGYRNPTVLTAGVVTA